ncbi:MAG: DUF4190 domain-containing protein [Actinobacteria bacterium]|nr:DUF4190 domain-containing protein [Actinomycetota bacterium]
MTVSTPPDGQASSGWQGRQAPPGWQPDGVPVAWVPDGVAAVGPSPAGPAPAAWPTAGPSTFGPSTFGGPAAAGRFGGSGTGYAPGVAQPPGLLVPRTEPTAVAGFICALLVWPVGLVLSIVGLARTGGPGVRGRGLAVAGLVISLVAALLTGLAASIVVPVYLRQREVVQQSQVSSALGATRDWLLTTQARNGAFPMALDSTAPATGDVDVRLVVDAAGGAPCLDATLGGSTMVALPQNGYQLTAGSCG